MTTDTDLELIALTKRYGGTVAVDAIAHHFKTGVYACLLGPSGCGKSSTLRMIAGHESVSDGSVVLGGRDISHLAPAKRGTAMMFQNYALFPHLSVRDNVAFSLRMAGEDKPTRDKRAMEMLELVEMTALADRIGNVSVITILAAEEDAHDRKGFVTDHVTAQDLNGGDCDVYLCGPPPMVDAVRDHFAKLGVEPANFYFEKFNPTEAEVAAA